MNDILLSPIRLNELETLIQNSVRKVLNENPKTMPQPESDTMFMSEVCRLTNCKRATIYSLVFKKAIPFIKPAGVKKLMFSRKAIEKWLLDRKC